MAAAKAWINNTGISSNKRADKIAKEVTKEKYWKNMALNKDIENVIKVRNKGMW